jgi:hypothetical protein
MKMMDGGRGHDGGIISAKKIAARLFLTSTSGYQHVYVRVRARRWKDRLIFGSRNSFIDLAN